MTRRSHPLDVRLGVHAQQVRYVGIDSLHLLHVAMKCEELPSDHLREDSQASLVLGMAPARIVKGRGGMKEEAGLRTHGG